MSHTVTITFAAEEYQRLQERFGDDPIDRVIKRLLRRYTVSDEERAASYEAMAADTEREAEAMAWIESAPDEGFEEWDEDWSWLRKQPFTSRDNTQDPGHV